ncbi:MAG: hypothetical protein IT559_04055 [Alphaproteobacteria bacterium]|nr:hypothetical protein [Alphaproteobacteria bacterium]
MKTEQYLGDALVLSDKELLENFNAAVRCQGFADPHGPDRFNVVHHARRILVQDDEFGGLAPEFTAVVDALRSLDEDQFTSANILTAVEGKLDLNI